MSRSCSTLKVTHQSSNAAETQYNWLCVVEVYSHFLVRDLKYKCVRQLLCVFPMVSMSHKDTLLEKCSLLVASWLGKTPIMRGSLVGQNTNMFGCLQSFFPLSFTVLWYWKFGESFQKIGKLVEFTIEKNYSKFSELFWQKTKLNHWLASVSKNPQNNINNGILKLYI